MNRKWAGIVCQRPPIAFILSYPQECQCQCVVSMVLKKYICIWQHWSKYWSIHDVWKKFHMKMSFIKYAGMQQDVTFTDTGPCSNRSLGRKKLLLFVVHFVKLEYLFPKMYWWKMHQTFMNRWKSLDEKTDFWYTIFNIEDFRIFLFFSGRASNFMPFWLNIRWNRMGSYSWEFSKNCKPKMLEFQPFHWVISPPISLHGDLLKEPFSKLSDGHYHLAE